MAIKIRLRRGTSTDWQNANPVLDLGEPGFEIDTGKLKIGDGSTPWNSLPYTAGEIQYLKQLDDVDDNLSPTNGQVLQYNGTEWTAGDVSTADEKVKADVSDPSEGYLSDKVDGDSISVDTVNHYLKVNVDDTTIEVDTTNHYLKVKDGVFADINHNHDSVYVKLEDYEDQDVLNKIKNVDGSGSGLDADLLDGLDSGQFVRSDVDDIVNGKLTHNNDIELSGYNLIKQADGGNYNVSNTDFKYLLNRIIDGCGELNGQGWTIVSGNISGQIEKRSGVALRLEPNTEAYQDLILENNTYYCLKVRNDYGGGFSIKIEDISDSTTIIDWTDVNEAQKIFTFQLSDTGADHTVRISIRNTNGSYATDARLTLNKGQYSMPDYNMADSLYKLVTSSSYKVSNSDQWDGGDKIISSSDPSGAYPNGSVWFKYQ